MIVDSGLLFWATLYMRTRHGKENRNEKWRENKYLYL